MRWAPASLSLADPHAALHRFGHQALAVDARATFGTDLVVCFGGVGARPTGVGAVHACRKDEGA